jgi:hypothetical protein
MLKKYIIKPLILFLLLSQFAAMAHAIEHQLDEADHEQCLICRQDTDCKNLLIDTTNQIKTDLFDNEKVSNTDFFYELTPYSLYRVRSPPSFLA